MTVGDERVRRVERIVCDLIGNDLDGVRILDLACDEGNFSIPLAQRGAEVVGVEVRDHVQAAIARAAELGLDRAAYHQSDVRQVTADRYGEFDVILCLGILYHLEAPAIFEFADNIARMCRRVALIETQIGLSKRRAETFHGHRYLGTTFPEDISAPGASIDNPTSFWPTKASLLNLLSDVGFTSVSESLNPPIVPVASFRDHLLLIATKGNADSAVTTQSSRWPEKLPRVASPTQGLRYRVEERFRRLRGGGLPPIFR
jgi:SAM-dependent methyltransferase